jgi:type VI secretion system FHA domain protein
VTVVARFSGPSFATSVVLQPGAAPVEAGRDANADIHLPDNDRLISRRHVAVEFADGGARVTVLSRVNGIVTSQGTFTEGQSVVLAVGDTATFGPFALCVDAVSAPSPAVDPNDATGRSGDDPWGEFAKDWVPAAPARSSAPAPARPINRAFDDAFSSSTAWHVEDMPVHDPLASASFDANAVIDAAFALPPAAASPPSTAPGAAAPADAALHALCRGLGVTPPPHMAEADWEHLGCSVQQVVHALLAGLETVAATRQDMRADDPTLLAGGDLNPLTSGMPMPLLLHYLLFDRHGVPGRMPAADALREGTHRLRAHEEASRHAIGAALQAVIAEFDPARLRGTLLQGKRSIATALDNARLWDLYTAHYEAQRRQPAAHEAVRRHYLPAYLREAERLRRESLPPRGQE